MGSPLTAQAPLTALYRAFNARDVETVLAALHPDVDWPNGMEGGRVRGHDAVRDYWTRQWTLIDPTERSCRISVSSTSTSCATR